MARFIFLVSTFLLIQISNAELTAERYWNHVLPNTPMPDVIRAYLYSGMAEEKATSVDVGGTGVVVHAPRASVNVGKGVVVDTPGPPGRGHVPVVVDAPFGPFIYNYAASEDQLKHDPTVALFFREEDLKQGKKMNLSFVKTTGAVPSFLPRASAEKLSFTSAKLLDILSRFSVRPDSNEASLVKRTLEECEQPSIKGETHVCATSLESMIDFSVSQLGTNRLRVLTASVRSNESLTKRTYTVEGAEKVASKNSVVCHSEPYAYAVFYCHKTFETRSYLVPLVSNNGDRVDAVAVCHTDTSSWNPKHIAFRVLGVKPATVPVCHFLPQDHLVWVPSS